MRISELAEQIARCLDDQADEAGGRERLSPLPGLLLLRYRRPTNLEATFYESVVCLILQGRKETTLGERIVDSGPGESLIVSHDLPVVSQVTKASPEKPYLAMILTLDIEILRSLHGKVVTQADMETDRARALDANVTAPDLIDALGRYLSLAAKPSETEVMAPLILQEIHFRLLLTPHGGMLRRLSWSGSHASKIARAIAYLRQNFRAPLSVPDLAKAVGMSTSSFYKHFRSITATTPLQYQKDLRLLEAQRLLSAAEHSVSSAAHEVGYESSTQFSREYARKFGTSPRNDLGSMR